jgi:carbon storage regulator CsrA
MMWTEQTGRWNDTIVLPALNVTIRIVAINGNRVGIGIEAPPEVKVVRDELLHRQQVPATHNGKT